MKKNINVLGAGLVGSLLSIYLAKRGHRVQIFERRPDMRKNPVAAGRSINLALSDRGWKALDGIGIGDDIRKIGIPMKGRMIHSEKGDLSFFPYGDENQAIYSVSRAVLNCKLMDLAEQSKNVSIHFSERCIGIDKNTNEISLENLQTMTVSRKASDVIFGADGAHSAARMHLQLHTDRFEYAQSYINYGYKELTIPPTLEGGFYLEKNALHIWPRKQFMMIALPNQDGSFTCTLFFPMEGENSFDAIGSSRDHILHFFNSYFVDAVPVMPTLVNDFINNPVSSLLTVKCFPWSFNDKIALIGDAAHAIVPFYGQGMNCGFEDCTVLNNLMERYGDDWEGIFKDFEENRKPNSDAIAHLALDNFIEMRDLMADPQFILRKKIEAWFSKKHPDKWLPLYTMVTFSDLPYSEAYQRSQMQDKIMEQVMKMADIEQKWESGKKDEVEHLMMSIYWSSLRKVDKKT